MGLELYFIRHAESELNLQPDLVVGQSSWAELTLQGIQQAKALGLYFKEKNLCFERAASSPSIRAQQTARYSLEQIGYSLSQVELVPELQERDLGDWDGHSGREVYVPSTLSQIEADPWDFRPPHGESRRDVFRRVSSWLEQEVLYSNTGKVALYTHYMLIGILLKEQLGWDQKQFEGLELCNTSLTMLKYEKGKFKELLLLNGTDHLKL